MFGHLHNPSNYAIVSDTTTNICGYRSYCLAIFRKIIFDAGFRTPCFSQLCDFVKVL